MINSKVYYKNILFQNKWSSRSDPARLETYPFRAGVRFVRSQRIIVLIYYLEGKQEGAK